MAEEIVSVLVHSPKLHKKDVLAGGGDSTLESKGDGQHLKKLSRRWLLLELERFRKRNDELSKQIQTRNEIEHELMDSKTKLEREVALLRSRRVTGSHENEAIRERNKQLAQDVFLMKKILVKLNGELERYQDKLRRCENLLSQDGKEITCEESRGSEEIRTKRQWFEGELQLFSPLLTAFEEALWEKDQLVSELRTALTRFSSKLKEILLENTQLREKIVESEKKTDVNETDWLRVDRELSLATEQNTLLRRQVAIGQAKLAQLKTLFEAKLGEVGEERDEAMKKLSSLRDEHLLLKGKYSALETELGQHRLDLANRIPKSVHEAYLAECKRLLDELKSRHEEERASLLKKQCPHDCDNVKSSEDISKIREVRKLLEETENRLVLSESRCAGLKSRLDALVVFSKELILEHETLLKAMAAAAPSGRSGEVDYPGLRISQRLSNIKNQIQRVEAETMEQIKLLDENIASQVERLRRQRTGPP